jgi:hypothetical protein
MRRIALTAFALFASTVSLIAQVPNPPRWHLELLHTIQPPESSPGSLGDVTGLAVLTDGSVVVAETKPPRVVLFDKRGKFTRVLMKQGDGPGETRSPVIAAAGDTILVFDGHQDRLTRLLISGRVVDSRTVQARPSSRLVALSNGAMAFDLDQRPDWDGVAMVARPNGHADTLLWPHPHADDLSFLWKGPGWDMIASPPFSPRGVAAFDPTGHLVVGGSRRSQWFIMSGRDTIRTVTLPDHAVPIMTRVRDSVWKAFYARVSDKKLPHMEDVVREDLIPKSLPPWVSFWIDNRGLWWIGRPAPSGVLAAWDIVSDGKVIGALPIPKRIVEHYLPGPIKGITNDLVALLHEDEDGVPSIGVYRLVRHP